MKKSAFGDTEFRWPGQITVVREYTALLVYMAYRGFTLAPKHHTAGIRNATGFILPLFQDDYLRNEP